MIENVSITPIIEKDLPAIWSKSSVNSASLWCVTKPFISTNNLSIHTHVTQCHNLSRHTPVTPYQCTHLSHHVTTCQSHTCHNVSRHTPVTPCQDTHLLHNVYLKHTVVTCTHLSLYLMLSMFELLHFSFMFWL